MATFKLTLEYDGSKYSGWQEQKNARSVQGELRKAAEGYLGPVELQGAGRTDAGVHALGQVAHLRLKGTRPPNPEALRRELNANLPASIAVLDVSPVPDTFHARHSAISRTYRYQIATRKTAFLKPYVWWIKERLDIPAMTRAAKMLEGRHDFTCFRADDPSRPDESAIVVVEHTSIEMEGPLLVFRITASHFVWRMVRRVTGVIARIGKHELTEADLLLLLKAKPVARLDVAAWTAPASGLFLESVQYPTFKAK